MVPMVCTAAFRWLFSVRFLAIFISVFFVIAASMTTGGVLWRCSVTSADQLGSMVMRQVQVQVHDSVLGALKDVVELSAIGAGLARQNAKESGGAPMNFSTLNETAWFNLQSINSFKQITNAGTFTAQNEGVWHLVFRSPNGEYKIFFQNCEGCLSEQWIITNTSLALEPASNRVFALPINMIRLWRNNNYLPTFDPPPGKEAMWGAITWGVAVPAPLVRIFATWIRGENGEFIGLDYKGVDLLQLNSLLHKVRPETEKNGELMEQTRIFLLDENSFLVGATHGGVGAPKEAFVAARPDLRCSQSLDSVVRASCSSTESLSDDDEFSVEGTEFMFAKFAIRDEYGLHFTACIAMPRDFVFGEVERGFEASITASVTVVIISIVSAFLLSFWLTQPLVRFVGRLEKCAEMDIDKDEKQPKPSFLREIAQLEISFRIMEKSLYEFKSFIPTTVFAESDTDRPHDQPQPSHNLSLNAVSRKYQVPTRIEVGVSARNASVLVSRLNPGAITDMKMSEAYTLMIEVVEQCSQTLRCVFTMNADSITVSFNTTYACKEHSAYIVAFAAEIENRVIALTNPNVIATGFATGPVHYGIAGTSVTKTFTVYGSAVNDAYQLSLCSGLGCNTLCTNDAKRVASRWKLLELAPFFPTVTGGRAYTPYQTPAGVNKEWMYDVDTQGSTEVDAYRRSLVHLELDEQNQAVEVLTSLLERNLPKVLQGVVAALKAILSRGAGASGHCQPQDPYTAPWEPQFYSFNLAKKPPLAVTNRESTGYSTMGGYTEQIRTKDNSN